MKILIYQPRCSYYVGGGEIVPLEQAKFLSQSGNEVVLITTEIAGIKKSDLFTKFVTENPDVNIEYIKVRKELLDLYKVKPGMDKYRWDLESLHIGLSAREKISEIIGNNDLCVLHYNVDLVAVPDNANYILHLHGYPEKLSYLDKLVMYKKSNFISDSKLIKDKWSKLLGISNSQLNIPVVYNGVDVKKFQPKSLKEKYDVGYIGRLIEIKGVQYIIEAVKILKEKNVTVKLVVAGTGPYERHLKNLVKQYNLENHIIFLGYVPDEQLVDFYNSVSFLVLPSYDREGVLTTLLEASACSVPVVSTKNTSMAEFIEDNKNGLLVDSKDSVALANSMAELVGNKKKENRVGEKCVKGSEAKLDMDLSDKKTN